MTILFSPWSVVSKGVFCVTLSAALFSLCYPVEAQRQGKVPRIGYLAARSALEPRDEAFRQGLRDLGYVEGKDITIEYRFAHGKREEIPKLAAEIVGLNVDIIVAPGTPK
jgi:putative ABC transport system substrate-binding protein